MRARRRMAMIGWLAAVPLLAGCGASSLVVNTTTHQPSLPPTATSSSDSTSEIPSIPTSTMTKRTSSASSSTRSSAVCQPTHLNVPSVGITDSVIPMGLNVDGELEPPPKQTIWYNASVHPGQAGISILAGHVQFGPPDNFWRLDEVAVGSSVSIRCQDGSILQLAVRNKASVNKMTLMDDPRVWGASSTPVVALITCDRHSPVVEGHHLSNFVVWAHMVKSKK